MDSENDYLRDRNLDLRNRIIYLEGELAFLIHTLENIQSYNTLGKTKQIADEINPILKHHDR
jgi:hypothetical protein